MIPVNELLARIRWDKDFGRGSFEIGYLDHIEQKIVRIPFEEITFEEGNHFSFQLQIQDDEALTIPFHRVREVYKDKALIWHRAP